MKKNGALLRDSITGEENAAARWPFFFSLFCFPPGANLSGCSILELEACWRKHGAINTPANYFSLELQTEGIIKNVDN